MLRNENRDNISNIAFLGDLHAAKSVSIAAGSLASRKIL